MVFFHCKEENFTAGELSKTVNCGFDRRISL